ncbi:MAG: TIGR00730 family Rossman fold protein [Bacteroidales bacterium]
MGKKICVYCSSSNILDKRYLEAANSFAEAASSHNWTVICGGSRKGLMGVIIDRMLELGGDIEGVMPSFMKEIELEHRSLQNLTLVDSMSRRKELLRENTHAVVALPGGIGTIEEFIETYTLKRLGIYEGCVAILNLDGFFNPMLKMFEHLVNEKMLNSNWCDSLMIAESTDELVEMLECAVPQRFHPEHYAPA